MRSYFLSAVTWFLAIGLVVGCQSPGPPKKAETTEKPAVQEAEPEKKAEVEPEPEAAEEEAPSPGPVVAEPSPEAAPEAEEKPAEEAPAPVAVEPEPEPVAAEPEAPAEEEAPVAEAEAPKEEAEKATVAPPPPSKKATTIRGEKPKLSADKLRMRVNYLESLVLKSASAKKVDASDNEEAKRTMARSRELYEQAKAAIDGGDLETADNAMRESMRLVGVASRMVASPEKQAAKEKEKFTTLRKSVVSFLEAIDRVVKENGKDKEDLGIDPAPIHSLLDEADALAAKGKHKEANVKLTEAYSLSSSAVAKLRDKETILITLEFETPEDEYNYVVKRNESYESLVKIMIQEKEPDDFKLKKIDGYVEESRSKMANAQELAGKGNFEEAIKVADNATKSLAKALRSLGLMVFD